MARLPDHKRIAKEDFEKDDQKLVEKLAYPINSFIEQVRNALNKNLDFDNLNQEIIEFTTSVDSSGNPLTPLQYKSNLNTRIRGMTCIKVEDTNNTAIAPVNTPFATFTQSTNIVTVSNITGLTANTQYRLRFLTFG